MVARAWHRVPDVTLGDPSRDDDAADETALWRNGVHLCGTAIWCDALRARDICFLSRADAVGRVRHGQIIATGETLLTIDDGGRGPDSVLSSPYGRPFTLGTRRLELVRSGHSLGAAGLAVDVDGQRVLYAGAVNPRGGGLGGTADVRPCDTLIVAAAYDTPSFPSTDDAAAALLDRLADRPADQATVLLVGSIGRALDVAARLGAAGIALGAHRTIHVAAQRLRRAQEAELPAMRRVGARDHAAGRVVLWPLAHRDTARAVAGDGGRVILVSGRAAETDAAAAVGADDGVAWSGHAGRDELIAYIESSGAHRVYLTHRQAEPLAAALHRRGRIVRPLGPPVQMTLFG